MKAKGLNEIINELVGIPNLSTYLYGQFVDSDIDKIIFNKPATAVFWNDGTKTVVKTSPNDAFDKEKGILWAYFLKHALGSKTQLQKEIMKYCEDE